METPPKCRLCGESSLPTLLELGEQPIAHRLLEPGDDGTDEFKHPLTIQYCRNCGLGQIIDPISPEILYKDFNYCFTSWKPEPHRPSQIEWLTGKKANASLFEIGCNDGLFLEEMKTAGISLGVGLEPNDVARKTAVDRGFHVYDSFLERPLIDEIREKYGQFDFVAARQVLEHVGDLDLFFEFARELLTEDGYLFIDVPDIEPSLEVGDVTIAWEEHVNYFTELVLKGALSHFGFGRCETRKYNFSGGCLSILSRKKSGVNEFPSVNLTLFENFNRKAQAFRDQLVETLEGARDKGTSVVLYGVGCRACAFVNGLELRDHIDFAVDDQQEKQKKKMPGSHLEIRPPEALDTPGDKLVLLAVNQENEANVRGALARRPSAASITAASVLGPADPAFALREALARP